MLFKKLKSVDSLCAISISACGSQIMLISLVWIVLTIATLLKTHWRLWFQGPELKPSFVLICLFSYSVAFTSVSIKKRSLFSNGSIFLRTPRDMEKTRCDWSFSIQIRFLLWSNWTHVGPAKNVPWLVTIIQICFLLWSRSQRPRDLQISPYDWSELFQICALLWQGWRRMFFNGFTTHSRKPQRKMHKIGIFLIYYKKFINREVALTLFLLNACENLILLWLQPISEAISFQFKWRKSSIHSESQCKLKLARAWGVLIYYTMTSHGDVLDSSVSWLVKLKARWSLKFQLRLRLRFRWNEDVGMNEKECVKPGATTQESARAEFFRKQKV